MNFRSMAAACAWALVSLCTSAQVPSQMPLLVRPTSSPDPNVMLVIDDSGSMTARFMPDTIVGVDLSDAFQIGMDPEDTTRRYAYELDSKNFTTDANDVWAARMRSPAVNTIYYNPAVRYLPWARPDGSSMADADPAAARRDPLSAAPTIDLRGEKVVPRATWCSSGLPDVNRACVSVSNKRYAPATWYEWTGDPAASTAFKRVRIMDSATFTRPVTRTDCSVAGGVATCTQAQEYRNFANWFVYHRTRLFAAIGGISHAFAARNGGIRLGWGRINTGRVSVDGAVSSVVERGVSPFTDAKRTAFFDWLYGIPAPLGTPLRPAMQAVGEYFSRSDAGSPWADAPWDYARAKPTFASCRASYHLLFTDGAWNTGVPTGAAAGNVDGTDGPTILHADGRRSWQYRPAAPFSDGRDGTLADIAAYYFNRDLQPGVPNAIATTRDGQPFWQAMTTYAIGFGVAGTLDPARDLPALASGSKRWPDPLPDGAVQARVDDLWHAALNGGGSYVNALDATGLQAALSTILDSIGSATPVSSAGVAVSGRTLDATTRKYVPSYRASDWSGDLQAFKLDSETGGQGERVWSAAERLPAPDRRNLWTWKPAAGGSPVAFRWDALQSAGMVAAFAAGTDRSLIDYLRGDRSGEGTTRRRRGSVLGDIVGSQPLRVKEGADLQYGFLPAGLPARTSYRAFRVAKAAREGVIFFGANDGFVHALRESDGVEIFGFMPAAVQRRVHELAQTGYTHRFYVDGPLMETDVYAATGWRNLVVGTAGAGAASVFAFDATDFSAPGAAHIRWELGATQLPRLGYVLAPPDAGLMADGSWAVVFGNGPGGDGGFAQLVIADALTGRVLRTIDADTAGGNGLGGVRLVRNAFNVVVAAYAGDLAGRLWRFDLQDTDPARWRVAFDGAPLYTLRDGARALAVTAAPEYVDHPKGGQLVLAGTGRLFQDADADDTAPQAIFGLWDTVVASTPAPARSARIDDSASLAAHSLSRVTVDTPAGKLTWDTLVAAPPDWSRQRGWKLPVSGGLRDIAGPRFERGYVRFALVQPAPRSTDACRLGEAGGLELQLQPLTGLMSVRPLFDTNGDGRVDASDLSVAGLRTRGEGPAGIVLGKGGSGRITDSRDAATLVDYGPPPTTRSWRQIVNVPR